LCLPPARGPAGKKREQQKHSIVTMEFKRFVAGVIISTIWRTLIDMGLTLKKVAARQRTGPARRDRRAVGPPQPERPLLQPLAPQGVTVAIPVEDLEPVPAFAAEHEQMTARPGPARSFPGTKLR
jgi:hypothetical protein